MAPVQEWLRHGGELEPLSCLDICDCGNATALENDQ
jgi:hypothetical protein